DSEIDAALMSLSGPPAAPTAPPAPTSPSGLAGPGMPDEEDFDDGEEPPPLPGFGDGDEPSSPSASLAPDPDSWLPPAFDHESLDDLEAVEVDEPTADYDPLLQGTPSLAKLAADLTADGEKE